MVRSDRGEDCLHAGISDSGEDCLHAGISVLNPIARWNLDCCACCLHSKVHNTVEPLYYGHFGTLISVLISEVTSIQRSFNTLQYYTGTQNGVLITEVFAIQRFVIERLHCIRTNEGRWVGQHHTGTHIWRWVEPHHTGTHTYVEVSGATPHWYTHMEVGGATPHWYTYVCGGGWGHIAHKHTNLRCIRISFKTSRQELHCALPHHTALVMQATLDTIEQHVKPTHWDHLRQDKLLPNV